MKSYKELSHDELLELQGALNKEYADAKSKGLNLPMARGKPSPEQLGDGSHRKNQLQMNIGIEHLSAHAHG